MNKQTPELRHSGTCAHCNEHTTDGIRRVIEQDSGSANGILLCADTTACLERNRTARSTR